MGKITVWTRQHKNVWEVLEKNGRYTPKKEYIAMENQEHTDIILRAYDWLVQNGPDAKNRPADVLYPVWVSFERAATMMPGDNGIILELCVEADSITPVNITKWGMILNYSYIPKDAADDKRHQELLKLYGINDVRAVMTQFYPEIKREITDSWKRLFEDDVKVGNDLKYGTIWELKREYVVRVLTENEA